MSRRGRVCLQSEDRDKSLGYELQLTLPDTSAIHTIMYQIMYNTISFAAPRENVTGTVACVSSAVYL